MGSSKNLQSRWAVRDEERGATTDFGDGAVRQKIRVDGNVGVVS